MKLTINKSISANRLNAKTGIPYSEQETNIPFGAILTYKGLDRDSARFIYLTELFRCKSDVLASALDGGKLPAEDDAAEAAAAPTAAAPARAPKPEAKLKFEELAAGPRSLARAKVPGGWLIAMGSSVTFLPDAQHSWNGESL